MKTEQYVYDPTLTLHMLLINAHQRNKNHKNLNIRQNFLENAKNNTTNLELMNLNVKLIKFIK